MTRLVAAVLCLVLAGCGGSPSDGAQVEVWVSAMDGGAMPKGLRVRSLEGPQGKTYRLVPLPSEGPRVHVADGAPDGAYTLEADGDWGMLWHNPHPPYLRRDAPEPLAIQMGKPYTVYVGRAGREYRFTKDWGVERVLPGGAAEPVPVTVDVDEANLVAVRLPKEAWDARVRLIGRLESGGATERLVIEPRKSPRPVLRTARAAPNLPLRVHLVGADGGPVQAVVRASVTGLPLEFASERASEGGVATFPALPILDAPLEVSVRGEGGSLRVDPGTWARTQDVRLLAAAGPSRLLSLPSGVVEVQTLAPGSSTFAQVPVTATGVVLPPGPQRLLLRYEGDRWAEVDLAADAKEATVVADDVRPGTHVSVTVRHGGGGVVRFLRREPDGRAVSGDGFEATVAPEGHGGTFLLPPGEYDVAWDKKPSDVRKQTLSPGSQAVVLFDGR